MITEQLIKAGFEETEAIEMNKLNDIRPIELDFIIHFKNCSCYAKGMNCHISTHQKPNYCCNWI